MGAGKIGSPQGLGSFIDTAGRMMKQSGPVRKELFKQGLEALTTGGVKAKIPLIQQAVSRSNQATSTALSQTSEQLAKHNVGGPFASRIMAGTRLAGDQGAAAIPTSIAEQVIANIMPFTASTQSLGMSSMSQAFQAQMGKDVFNAQQFLRSVPFMQTGQQGLIGGICLHPETRIETPEGSVPVNCLEPGNVVWTEDDRGQRVPAFVTAYVERYVGPDHELIEFHAPGGPFLVSPGHPQRTGVAIGFCGRRVKNTTEFTCDIAVSGPTGVYFVNGQVLGSTLDSRHVRRAA